MSLPPCLQWLTLTDYSHSLTPAEIGWVFVTPFYSWRIPLLISLGRKQSCNLPEKLEMSGNKSSPAYWVARAEASDPGSARLSQSEVHSGTQSRSFQVTKVRMTLWQQPPRTSSGLPGYKMQHAMSITAAVAITVPSPHLPAGDMLDQVLDIEPSLDSFCPIYKPGSEGLLLMSYPISIQ